VAIVLRQIALQRAGRLAQLGDDPRRTRRQICAKF